MPTVIPPKLKTIIPTSDIPPLISVIGYNESTFMEQVIQSPEEIKPFLENWSVVWVNVDGTGAELIHQIGKLFNLHPLTIEDVLHLQERAKVDEFEDYAFIIARMIAADDHPSPTEQISIILNEKWVLTFQERAGGDCLDPIRQRIRRHIDDFHNQGTAYLVYSMLETITDAYFPVVEAYGDHLNELEDKIAQHPTRDMLTQVHQVKRDLLLLRRAVTPMRDVIHMLMHDNRFFDSNNLNFYLRDGYDHVLRVLDLIEADRELCADLMDFYLSTISNRTNDVMKVLTIISTIFMPLTFVAGVYGMNFNPEASPFNMPELNWYFGYPFALFLMVGMVGIMLYLYRRRGWL